MNADQYCWEAWTLRCHHASGGKSLNIPEGNGGCDGKFIEVNGGFFNAILPQGAIAAMEIISESSRNGKCSVAMLNYWRVVDVLDAGTPYNWTSYYTTTLRKHPSFHLISPISQQTSQGYMVVSEIQGGTSVQICPVENVRHCLYHTYIWYMLYML